MDFFDETNETITRDMILSGKRDTSYMYANHKTSTYIDAINQLRTKAHTVVWLMKHLRIKTSMPN